MLSFGLCLFIHLLGLFHKVDNHLLIRGILGRGNSFWINFLLHFWILLLGRGGRGRGMLMENMCKKFVTSIHLVGSFFSSLLLFLPFFSFFSLLTFSFSLYLSKELLDLSNTIKCYRTYRYNVSLSRVCTFSFSPISLLPFPF